MTGDRHGAMRYDFMHTVVLPEHDQARLFESSVRPSVDIFIHDRSVLFFAYGQTGTGKTCTILRPEASQATVRHEDWGVFPRAVDATLSAMAAGAKMSPNARDQRHRGARQASFTTGHRAP